VVLNSPRGSRPEPAALCEHTFVSIKGRPGQWFEAAVRRGDLCAALAEVPELPQPLPLGWALALVVLLDDASDPRYPRWAARWAGRIAVERDTVDLSALAELVRLLNHGRELDAEGRRRLVELAERHGAVGVQSLLLG
jgi:hypothetical protein